jgi:hypothetical protein
MFTGCIIEDTINPIYQRVAATIKVRLNAPFHPIFLYSKNKGIQQ